MSTGTNDTYESFPWLHVLRKSTVTYVPIQSMLPKASITDRDHQDFRVRTTVEHGSHPCSHATSP